MPLIEEILQVYVEGVNMIYVFKVYVLDIFLCVSPSVQKTTTT